MAQEPVQLPHKLVLNERTELTLTGVREVAGFDDTTVVLRTSLGTLTAHGSGLHLKQLTQDGGQVAVEGRISALVYEENKPAGGFWRRMLG